MNVPRRRDILRLRSSISMNKIGLFLLSLVVLLPFPGKLLRGANRTDIGPLPDAVSNNAVASLRRHGGLWLFSFMGIGPKKTWDAITPASYALNPDSYTWSSIPPVPGLAARLGAVAAGVGNSAYLMGGYVVDPQGNEKVVSDAGQYDVVGNRWLRAPDMPIPVRDSVAGVYRERYIYLIGGRSNGMLVSNVQVLDTEKGRWFQATPITGTLVFGHAGALVGDTIIYVDGATLNPAGGGPRFVAVDECWMGKIDHHDPRKIQWNKLPSHPGNARYRIAAGGSGRDERVYFSGGTDNPYDFTGVGYDGKPAEPSPVTFAFNLRSGKWETIDENTPGPTMDHRGLLVTYEELVLAGGMEKGQKVTPRTSTLPKEPKGKKP